MYWMDIGGALMGTAVEVRSRVRRSRPVQHSRPSFRPRRRIGRRSSLHNHPHRQLLRRLNSGRETSGRTRRPAACLCPRSLIRTQTDSLSNLLCRPQSHRSLLHNVQQPRIYPPPSPQRVCCQPRRPLVHRPQRRPLPDRPKRPLGRALPRPAPRPPNRHPRQYRRPLKQEETRWRVCRARRGAATGAA